MSSSQVDIAVALYKESEEAHKAAYLYKKEVDKRLDLREGYWYWKGERMNDVCEFLMKAGILDIYGNWVKKPKIKYSVFNADNYMKKAEVVAIIDKEIEWCKKNTGIKTNEHEEGFINGLEQAKRLIENL